MIMTMIMIMIMIMMTTMSMSMTMIMSMSRIMIMPKNMIMIIIMIITIIIVTGGVVHRSVNEASFNTCHFTFGGADFLTSTMHGQGFRHMNSGTTFPEWEYHSSLVYVL